MPLGSPDHKYRWLRAAAEIVASITLHERDLVRRTNELHTVFAPLRVGRERVSIGFAKDSPGGTIVLVVRDKTLGRSGYRQESFRTSVDALRCQYFELWRASTGGKRVLNRAYFTLLEVVVDSHEFRELLCIHTDPTDEDELKQGPHLHVKRASEPIPHCHFPLEFGFLAQVLKNCDSLTKAMGRAISVIGRDVLPRY